jgi:hypothetical protein
MTAYRVLVLQKPVDRPFLLSIIDGVLLPAVGIRMADSFERTPAG